MEVSVIIPSRRERFLDKTILEIQKKLKGSYEIIVVLDGEDANRINGVKYIYNKVARGMRTAINQAVAVAKGKYLLKLDAHCMLDQGIDEKLKAVHQDNWVQIPRRKRMDANKWEITTENRPDIDYMFLDTYLIGHKDHEKNRNMELRNKLIDDTEAFQGSCYFITKNYFLKLGLLDDKKFGGSGREAQEIAFKCWMDGGRTVVNKTTWYAHAHIGRKYARDKEQIRKSEEALFQIVQTI